jgi:nicotinamide mononucleotide transporter
LLDNKKLDNWIVWLVMDVFATWEYYHTGLYLVGFQYIFFTINTFVGLIWWLRSYRNQKASAISSVSDSTFGKGTHDIEENLLC